MKSKKTTWIWSLSIAAALLVILLQAYWLHNQYRFELEKAADETISQTLQVWNNYKTNRKAKLKNQRENLKAYNTNMNQSTSTIYVSDVKEYVTDWTISIHTVKKGSHKTLQSDTDEAAKPEEQKIRDAINNSQRLATQTVESITETLKKDSAKIGTKNEVITETLQENDTTNFSTFRFKTIANQGLVYDAVDLFLADINLPFATNELDSLIRQKTGIVAAVISIDTLLLPPDSVLWESASEKALTFLHPRVTVKIPYNVLKRKVAEVTVSLVPAQIIKTMAFQIIASLILIFVLIICLSLQIQTISRQQRIGKLRQNFVHTTLHELKRPVQTLKTIVAYLQTQVSKESEMLSDARVETDNLTSYLQKLHDVNEGESISESLQLSYFDFVALTNETVEKMQKNATKVIAIETHFPAESLTITADKEVVRNILVNLLENAAKYSGEEPRIVIRAHKKNNTLVFSLADNGIGISPAEQNAIFEPFYRAKNSYVASLPGMGLGLCYVKMAVEAHKGTIAVQSKMHQGTTFTIEIPLQ